MDIFIEQIIKKKFGKSDYLVFAAVLLGSCVILGIFAVCIPMLLLPVLVGVFAADYYLITSRNLEYEYSVTNGDITIDKVISRRKRKRVISVDAHNIEEMGKFKPEIVRNKSSYKPYFASEYDDGRDSWYFCAHTSKEGNVLVVFDPDEKVMGAMKPFIPRQVAFVVFGRH